MSIKERVNSPTPRFFQTIRNIGLIVAAVGASILGAPVVLPAIIMKIGGYLVVAGSIASAISQATVTEDRE